MEAQNLTTFGGVNVSGDLKIGEATGAIEQLDHELDRLEGSLGDLSIRVGPIMNQYATTEAKIAEPRPEPRTQLLGRVERLSGLVNRLQAITSDIDL